MILGAGAPGKVGRRQASDKEPSAKSTGLFVISAVQWNPTQYNCTALVVRAFVVQMMEPVDLLLAGTFMLYDKGGYR
jgi:hypothetical protein